MMKSNLARAGTAVAVLMLALFVQSPVAWALPAWPTLTVAQSVGGFVSPTSIAAPDDGSGRLFVTEQRGTVRLVTAGSLSPTPSLDMRGIVTTGGERGLLSIAFPPGFASKQYAYVYYTGAAGAVTVSRVRVSAGDPNVFDPGSMQTILSVRHPRTNHNGGQLAFGPDGYLYVGIGDGGGAGDPNNYARNLRTYYGKILRIDVESTPASPGFLVPRTNPYVGSRIRPRPRTAIWARGLRNPWRFSFDAPTSSIWIGDVGQNKWEEIDRVRVRRYPYDFGWSRYEGTHLYKARRRLNGFTWPIAQYSHAVGESVTGGYVYRGAANPPMYGIYIFGDFVSGRIWGIQPNAGRWVRALLMQTSGTISTFGVDGTGELWFADYGAGAIHRLAASP